MAVSLGRLEVETADHVVLRYDLAGGGNRGFAALVDFIVATLIFIGALFVFTTIAAAVRLSVVGQFFGVGVLLTFTIAWGYFILFEWLGNGQTLGKRIFGLRVIADDGAPAGFTAVLVRNLVRVVDFLPGFYGFGLVSIVLSPKSQRLGDLAAGTFVVRAPRPQLDYFSLRTVTPLGAGAQVEVRALSGEAQRLVREFVAREAKLAPDHRSRVAKQLAERLRPYARDVDPGLEDVELIRAIARSLRASGGDR
ncbi:MAG TPA: RDD family protein [Candidatus Limnocylindria bacterium]|nr:RDD family protein [Candidatus Limnocylindria bacterium]